MTLSIRARLTLWYGALIALALAVFSVGVLWLHARWGRAQFDSELASLGSAAARVMEEELNESGNLRHAVAETRTAIDVPGRTTAILDAAGEPLTAHWRGFEYRAVHLAAPAPGDRPAFATVVQRGTAWRILSRAETSPAGGYIIFVAGPLDQLARQQYLLSRVLLVAGPIIVLFTAAVSWWAASSALRPVTTMARQAAAITAASADWRLGAATASDELGKLARAFNQLLSRLAAAAQMQRQFMADASHELRTPVSVIQTAAEVTLDQPSREEWEYREALTIVVEQSARLSRMVEDMFVLARADAGGYDLSRRRLYLDEVAAACVRAAAIIAATKDIRVTSNIEPDVPFDGNETLLHQLIANLLDNAVQYTPNGGGVDVNLSTEHGGVTIAVSDTGPGIPPADRERVFDRFVRLDPARSATSGAGLGLPIARWIAEQHGGTIAVEDRPGGGAAFVVRLPAAAAGHPAAARSPAAHERAMN